MYHVKTLEWYNMENNSSCIAESTLCHVKALELYNMTNRQPYHLVLSQLHGFPLLLDFSQKPYKL